MAKPAASSLALFTRKPLDKRCNALVMADSLPCNWRRAVSDAVLVLMPRAMLAFRQKHEKLMPAVHPSHGMSLKLGAYWSIGGILGAYIPMA
jgi:hypothetical protein